MSAPQCGVRLARGPRGPLVRAPAAEVRASGLESGFAAMQMIAKVTLVGKRAVGPDPLLQ